MGPAPIIARDEAAERGTVPPGGVDLVRYGDQAMSSMQQIEALLEGLSRDELLSLIEHIARRLRQHEEHKPQPLYGI
jgi:hypothetical protein